MQKLLYTLKTIKQQNNIIRLFIIFLLIWNIFLTLPYIPQIPQPEEKLNQEICNLELIPEEQLDILEAVGE